MGFQAHHAIVLTSWKYEHLEKALNEAIRIGLSPTEATSAGVNGYQSFMIPPDGSKEGWKDSDEGDEKRQAFKQWMREQGEDLYVEWAELRYGSDDDDAAITDHAWKGPDALDSTAPR